MKRFLSAVALAAAVSVVALPSTASAKNSRQGSGGTLLDRSSHDRDSMISVFGLVPYGRGFAAGLGLRYTLPIVEDGFIPPVNDSFELEFGGDFALNPFYGYDDEWYFWSAPLVVEARWTFHIAPKFDAYAKVGLGFEMDYYSYGYYDNGYHHHEGDWDLYPHHTETLGLLLKLTDSMYLRAEAGYPDVRVGLGFDL